jgi:hypothetical protein
MFSEGAPMPFPVIAIFIVFMVLITFKWGRWWYAQRDHFRD